MCNPPASISYVSASLHRTQPAKGAHGVPMDPTLKPEDVSHTFMPHDVTFQGGKWYEVDKTIAQLCRDTDVSGMHGPDSPGFRQKFDVFTRAEFEALKQREMAKLDAD